LSTTEVTAGNSPISTENSKKG